MPTRRPRAPYLLAASTGLVTFLVYLPALANGFIELDDSAYVTENPNIRTMGPALLRWSFLQFNVANWHPLTWLSHALDYAIWGLDPVGHHLTSIVLHAVVTAAVTVLAYRLLAMARWLAPRGARPAWGERGDLLAAGVTGLLFGLHPVHVESVAWVAERKDLLSALFFVLAAGAWLGPTREPGDLGAEEAAPPPRYLAALGFFVLALLSKPMAVTLPAVLLLLDWYPLRRIRDGRTLRGAVTRTLPFWLLSAASSVITVLAQRSGRALVSVDALPLGPRLLAAARSLVAYLGKMALPLDIAPYYPYPDFRSISLASPGYLLPVVIVLAVTGATLALARRRPLWLVAWAYYVVTLLPVLGVIQVGGQAMADRYTYLPSLSPFLLAGMAVAWLGAKAGERGGRSVLPRLVAVAALAVLAGLAVLTVRQIRIWKDGTTVFEAILSNPARRSPMVFFHRGVANEKSGRLQEAVSDFSAALSLFPAYPEAHFARGTAYEALGELELAREDYRKASSLDPRSHEALTNLGRVERMLGHRDAALANLRAAVALEPTAGKAHLNLGILLAEEGRLALAVDEFTRAIAADASDADAYGNRGIALAGLGEREAARSDLDTAVRFRPADPGPYFNRGQFLAAMGERAAARADFEKACRLGDAASCQAAARFGP